MAKRFFLKKNFNIASTIINSNMRVYTAAIFYENSFFGDYYQLETFVFCYNNEGKFDPSTTRMKIHDKIPKNQIGIDYLVKYHNRLCSFLKSKYK